MEVGDEKNGTPPGSDARGADRGERGGVGGLHPVPQRPPRQHRDLLGYTRSRRNNRNQSKRLYRRSARRRSHPRGKRSRPYPGDDYWLGEDENHGGPGADHIVGNYDSEKHFGGRGDDLLVDEKSDEEPDVFRCGPGYDYVYYNKGLDKVADDCEELISSFSG